MGAVVRAFDTREAVREQVHSMGAEFLEVHLKVFCCRLHFEQVMSFHDKK